MTTPTDVEVADSILLSTKKLLGIDPTMDMFDLDITTHVNASLANLNQIGIGPKSGYVVTGPEQTWGEFLTHNNLNVLQNVRQYVYIQVRMVFDPPGASNHLAALQDMLKQIEWRISVGREEIKNNGAEQ